MHVLMLPMTSAMFVTYPDLSFFKCRGKLCRRSVKCSKQNQHRGKCDSKRLPKVKFWEFTRKSLVCQKEKEIKEQFHNEAERLQRQKSELAVKEGYLQLKEDELDLKAQEISKTSEALVAETRKQTGVYF